MHSTTVAVDLAKDVIEVAVAGGQMWHERLSRAGFTSFLAKQNPSRIVMESCGGAHYWARKAQADGHEVTILPALYVKAYRRRNKTDRADCLALLEAVKNPQLKPVAVKSQLQQAVQGLHRLRSADGAHQHAARLAARVRGDDAAGRQDGVQATADED